ncbi:Eukaryotic translation initiation factor 3 subunit D [Platanthera zijinensis]|uniref:Eukaryotic translation initiation factor 3 subunit D n=1 Tax=Platanthera zijinensis TaxID=2320716 RepID=A0AAP0G0U0_9ASPA
MAFDIGVAPYNPDGWGPPHSLVAPLLSRTNKSIAGGGAASHIPFSRSDKLGRIADWTRNTNFTNPPHSGTGRDAVFGLDDSSTLAVANDRRLECFKSRNFVAVTTTDDPVIPQFANKDKAAVFANDAILSTLMCAPRSLDRLSVNETSSEVLPEAKEGINSAHSLVVEAAYINQNFSQQVLLRDGNKVTFDEPNPFASEGEEITSVAYRYRHWKLDQDTYLIARCEVHCVADSIVDLCMKLNEGKYVLVKDPMKPQVRIYEVPVDTFENDYMEEPLPEEEQVRPPTEDEAADTIAENQAEGEAIDTEVGVGGRCKQGCF